MPHDNEQKGLFGSLNLLTGEVGQRVRAIMERGMVANKKRLSADHVSKLISFTPYGGIQGGPLSLVREAGSQWWPGWMIASDSSPVEAGLGDDTNWYTSNRVLLSTVVALGLNAQGVKQSADQVEQQGVVDPDWSATSLRQSGVGEQGSGQIFLVLPGNGILYRHEGASKLPRDENMGFRHAMEEMLRNNRTWAPDKSLWKTYTRLLRDWKPNSIRPHSHITFKYQDDAWECFDKNESGLTYGVLRACPQCRQSIGGGAVIQEAPDIQSLSNPGTYFDCPNCEEQTRIIDACGLTYLYRPDQSNLNAMNAFSLFVEHLLLYSWCEQFRVYNVGKKDHETQYVSVDSAPIFIIDGPLALFGPCGRFTSAFRHKIQEAVGGGATIFGIVKTGHVRNFLDGLPDELRGGKASYFIIPDRLRYQMIEVSNKKPSHYGFGEFSHYGHDVIVRTRRGLRFVLSVATPEVDPKWWRKEDLFDSLDHKANVIKNALTTALPPPLRFGGENYSKFNIQEQWFKYAMSHSMQNPFSPPLWRVISTLEHVESLMFQQSSIPQVFAHMLAGTQATLMRAFLRTVASPEQASQLNEKSSSTPAPPSKPKSP